MLGMMIEVPAVVLQLDSYVDLADFFSVGSNDLVQYLLAVDRNNEQVRNLYSPLHPAVMRALSQIVEFSSHRNVPLSICGEMAGKKLTALALISPLLAVGGLLLLIASLGYLTFGIALIALDHRSILLKKLKFL